MKKRRHNQQAASTHHNHAAGWLGIAVIDRSENAVLGGTRENWRALKVAAVAACARGGRGEGGEWEGKHGEKRRSGKAVQS